MGVMACDRQSCENIMCDHYSSEHGYVCHDCLSELQGKVGQMSIGEFMASRKGEDKRNEMASEKNINDTFRPLDG